MALRILLADGNITNQNAGRKILAAADHDVITVSNGLKAMRKLAEAQLDLLLLDVHLPGYGGIEICEKVKTTPEMAHIAVLLSVGKLDSFGAAECIKAKADGFIFKPFEAGELVVAVDKHAERVGDHGSLQQDGREVCDVCGYVNQEYAFVCQQCDVPLPSSASDQHNQRAVRPLEEKEVQ